MSKKIAVIFIVLFMGINMIGNFSIAAELDLINNVKLELKINETPNRLEVSFDLSEAIDLSVGDSNIIFEYFIRDENGELEAINYRKDKSWAGYLNSYDNYPKGEQKYSSGTDNANYSDNVPVATIYTSVKTSGSIDVAKVAAVKITVLNAIGSGEAFTIYSNVSDVDKNTGILLESTAAVLPVDTVMTVDELTDGSMYEIVNEVLVGSRNFVVFDIKLKLEDQIITPNGYVKLNIPIPQSFQSPYLKVYRIDDDGKKTPYEVTVSTIKGIEYASFETEHFSTYALLELDTYPYMVKYYRDTITQSNLIDTINGDVVFAEGHQLTANDITTDLGEGWINLKKPSTGYNNGSVQGGYPVISQITEDNTVKVLYERGSTATTTYYTITVEYKDISDNTISKKKSASIKRGEPYNISAAAITGYRHVETIVNGEIQTADRTPLVNFTDKDYSIIFRYDLNRPVLNKVSHDFYISGYGNNEIQPDNNLTRAETAMLFWRLIANVDKDAKEPRKVFSDIEKDAWYAKALTYLYDYNIISGYDDAHYWPDNFITRAEIAKLFSMFGALEIPISNTFSDVPKTHWAYSYIASAVHEGWISGYSDGTFHPENYITRAEMISLINKVLNRRVKTENLLADLHIWDDISDAHWAYSDIMEATHSHTFVRENESDYEIWLSITETGASLYTTY